LDSSISANKRLVYEEVKKAIERDKSMVKVSELSRHGLMEITRKRVGCLSMVNISYLLSHVSETSVEIRRCVSYETLCDLPYFSFVYSFPVVLFKHNLSSMPNLLITIFHACFNKDAVKCLLTKKKIMLELHFF